MGSSALRCQTDLTTSTGLKIYCHPILLQTPPPRVMGKLSEVLILELEPTVFTLFSVHPFWGGVSSGQVASLEPLFEFLM